MGSFIGRFIPWVRPALEGHVEECSSSNSSRSSSTQSLSNIGSTDSLITFAPQTPVRKTGPSSKEVLVDLLPVDLLLRIFSFLDVVSLCRCAQVSKKWNELALDGSNWQHVDLFDFQADIEEQVVVRLSARCGGFLRTLSLKGCEGVRDTTVSIFSSNCKLIETLILNKCHQLSDSALESLSANCSNLRHLDLSSCRGLTDESCRYLFLGCKELEYINLSYCSISPEGVKALTGSAVPVSIKHIFLNYCNEINNDAMKSIGLYCPELLTLSIQGCRLVTDEGIKHITDGCPKLTRLAISRVDQLTDQSLRNLGSSCHMLTKVEAAGCSQFTDAGFTALAIGCKGLTRLDLEECVLVTDVTLDKLSTHCTHLERLVLSHCERITDIGINHLVASGCGDKLQVLELDNCPLVTDESLERLRSCSSLKRLEVFDCQLISRSGINRFRRIRKEVTVHAYFPPNPPDATPSTNERRRVTCQCCCLI